MTFTTVEVFEEVFGTPTDVCLELETMQQDYEISNNGFVRWNSERMGEKYPAIDAHFLASNVTECLILFSW